MHKAAIVAIVVLAFLLGAYYQSSVHVSEGRNLSSNSTTSITASASSTSSTSTSTTSTSTSASTSILYPGAVISPILFGQANATEASPNTVTPFKMFHGAGVIVDRSSKPNKVYVIDSGNNRILGYNGIGYCRAAAEACTDDSDCQNGADCIVNGTKAPDMVFGQPNFYTGACNGNDSTGIYGTPGANTLCLTGYPLITNTAEDWMRINGGTDGQGNLYVVDQWNNRVLRYNSPFSANKSEGKGDSTADLVIGQPNFTANTRNRGSIALGPVSAPSNDTLWLNAGNGINNDWVSTHGVSVDYDGNVWVADTFNDRILRFSAGSSHADLVLGQPNMTANATGAGCVGNAPRNELCTPTLAMIRPDTGELYVLDEHPGGFQARILVFEPPFHDGMNASRTIMLDGGFTATGFAFNPYPLAPYVRGIMWISEINPHNTVLIDDQGNIIATIVGGDQDRPCNTSQSVYDGFNIYWAGGSIGFDDADNIYLADANFNRISRYALPYQRTVINGTACYPSANGGLFPRNH